MAKKSILEAMKKYVTDTLNGAPLELLSISDMEFRTRKRKKFQKQSNWKWKFLGGMQN